MSGFTDGNFIAQVLTKNVVSYPLSDKPGNSGTMQFDLTYLQYANAYVALTVGGTDANAPLANFYSQGPVERVGAGVVRYTRSFMQQPVTWYEMEQVAYTYPGLDSGVGTNSWVAYGARSSITKQKLATIEHKYVINSNVPYANMTNVFLVTLFGQPINRIGQWSYVNTTLTVPSTDPSIYTISCDGARFKGNLWEIVTKTVTQANVFP